MGCCVCAGGRGGPHVCPLEVELLAGLVHGFFGIGEVGEVELGPVDVDPRNSSWKARKSAGSSVIGSALRRGERVTAHLPGPGGGSAVLAGPSVRRLLRRGAVRSERLYRRRVRPLRPSVGRQRDEASRTRESPPVVREAPPPTPQRNLVVPLPLKRLPGPDRATTSRKILRFPESGTSETAEALLPAGSAASSKRPVGVIRTRSPGPFCSDHLSVDLVCLVD